MERKRVVLCDDGKGNACTLTARYSAMCWSNVAFGGGHYPMTAILEIRRGRKDAPRIEKQTDNNGKTEWREP